MLLVEVLRAEQGEWTGGYNNVSLEWWEGKSDSCFLPRLTIPQSLGITPKQPTRHWQPTPVSTAKYGIVEGSALIFSCENTKIATHW